jgi:hypothetical protein
MEWNDKTRLSGERAMMLLTLHKDWSVSTSWDLQYNCEGYMALALVKYEDLF